MVANEAF